MFTGTDRYEVIRRLGVGGMGAVYLVNDRVRHQRLALKVMKRVESRNLVRFKREFRAVVGLRHPNLVRLFELEEADDTLFYTMELIEGTDLGRYVYRDRPDLFDSPKDTTVDQPLEVPGDDEAPVEATAIVRTRGGERKSSDPPPASPAPRSGVSRSSS